MTFAATAGAAPSARPPLALLAFAGTLAVVALQAADGFATLSAAGADNDSLLRLVQVRDLIAGQGWFDLHQYRLGTGGGVIMHWSRLVDAPIALLVMLFSALTGSAAAGETAALVAWPALLFAAALYSILRAARLIAGDTALLPALVIGAAALHFTGVFAPGAIDHHNVQLALTLALAWQLCDMAETGRAIHGALAGALAALLLAIAMEGAPLVAAGGASAAGLYLMRPRLTARASAAFGLSFGAIALGLFAATVSVAAWPLAQCDTYSLPQAALAALAGFGLASVAAGGGTAPLWARAISLAGLALAAIAVTVALFPQCLGDPYAGLDPRLKAWWLDAVTEAQPFWKVVTISPAMAAGYYATPVLALVLLARRIGRREASASEAILMLFLAAAVLVSLWQVRGAVFAVPLAAVALAATVARARDAAPHVRLGALRMAAAWLTSFAVVWNAAAAQAVALVAPASDVEIAAIPQATCGRAEDFARLAALPPAGVLAVSNLGAPILRHTHHRVLAGPYHRNVAGNLAVLDAFAGRPDAAREVAAQQGLTLIAHCPGNDESRVLAEGAPGALMDRLLRGDVPGWLEKLPAGAGDTLQLYRIRP